MPLGAQLQVALRTQAALAILGDMGNSLTATGTNQATAYAITTANSVFTTVDAGTGARLPVTGIADRLHVANCGTNTLMVYPPSGGKLNNMTSNVPAAIPPNKTADFVCIDGTNYTALLSA